MSPNARSGRTQPVAEPAQAVGAVALHRTRADSHDLGGLLHREVPDHAQHHGLALALRQPIETAVQGDPIHHQVHQTAAAAGEGIDLDRITAVARPVAADPAKLPPGLVAYRGLYV